MLSANLGQVRAGDDLLIETEEAVGIGQPFRAHLFQTRALEHLGGLRSGEIGEIFMVRTFAFGSDAAVFARTVEKNRAGSCRYPMLARANFPCAARQQLDRMVTERGSIDRKTRLAGLPSGADQGNRASPAWLEKQIPTATYAAGDEIGRWGLNICHGDQKYP